jgi:hypothetical protein
MKWSQKYSGCISPLHEGNKKNNPHYGRGLCSKCWHVHDRNGELSTFPRKVSGVEAKSVQKNKKAVATSSPVSDTSIHSKPSVSDSKPLVGVDSDTPTLTPFGDGWRLPTGSVLIHMTNDGAILLDSKNIVVL